MKIEVSGIDEVLSRLTKAQEQLKFTPVEPMKVGVNKIMMDSLIEVPKDTTALAQSSFIHEPLTEGAKVTIEFGYGLENRQINPETGQGTEKYAWIQHEDTTLNHPRGGNAHFLSNPFYRWLDRIKLSVLDSIKSMLKEV